MPTELSANDVYEMPLVVVRPYARVVDQDYVIPDRLLSKGEAYVKTGRQPRFVPYKIVLPTFPEITVVYFGAVAEHSWVFDGRLSELLLFGKFENFIVRARVSVTNNKRHCYSVLGRTFLLNIVDTRVKNIFPFPVITINLKKTTR